MTAAFAGAATPPAVSVRDLAVRIGRREILRGVSFDLDAGRALAVLGPNGAGKTTLLKTLATLLRPSGGRVTLFGLDTVVAVTRARRDIGYVGHETFVYPQLSGRENLVFWARAYGLNSPARRAAEMLSFAGLEAFADEPARGYSRGMLQRLTLARALVHDPRLLLLDEPHTGLDRHAAALLDRVVADWRGRGRAVVLTSHDWDRARSISDETLVLERGRVVPPAPGTEARPAEARPAGTRPPGTRPPGREVSHRAF